MVDVLGDMISALSDTVGAWNKFRRNDIKYFSYDGKPPTSSSLNQTVAAVGRTLSDLEDLLQKLKDLEKTLCKGVSQLSLFFEREDKMQPSFDLKAKWFIKPAQFSSEHREQRSRVLPAEDWQAHPGLHCSHYRKPVSLLIMNPYFSTNGLFPICRYSIL